MLYHCLSLSCVREKEICDNTKTMTFRTVCRPVLIYGCESWVLYNPLKSKLQIIEMKFLRGFRGVMRSDWSVGVKAVMAKIGTTVKVVWIFGRRMIVGR